MFGGRSRSGVDRASSTPRPKARAVRSLGSSDRRRTAVAVTSWQRFVPDMALTFVGQGMFSMAVTLTESCFWTTSKFRSARRMSPPL